MESPPPLMPLSPLLAAPAGMIAPADTAVGPLAETGVDIMPDQTLAMRPQQRPPLFRRYGRPGGGSYHRLAAGFGLWIHAAAVVSS